MLKVAGKLPVSVKLLYEGEEEIGSPGLTAWLPQNKERLACDLVLVSDTSMLGPGQPSIDYGLRGLTYCQVDLKGPAGDLHSGGFGGAVANPINVLAGLLAALKDENQRVTIPGFYDDVLDLDEQERANFGTLPEGSAEVLADSGAPATCGEAGFTTAQRLGARPSLDANGIWGGFSGTGAKTVLPAEAGMKVSMRLVPNQDPQTISDLFRAHLEKIVPETVKMTITDLHNGHPFLCPLSEPALQKAAQSLTEVFGKKCLFVRGGGSIPIVAEMARELKRPVVLMGFGLLSEQAHAPNEHFDLGNFHLGLKASLTYLRRLAD
jgi:acetylornithine deacetylase/succinyl-diaminopimelate desuccinylase-like protein